MFIWSVLYTLGNLILSGAIGIVVAVEVPIVGPPIFAIGLGVFYGVRRNHSFLQALVTLLAYTSMSMMVFQKLDTSDFRWLSVLALITPGVFWGMYFLSWWAFGAPIKTEEAKGEIV